MAQLVKNLPAMQETWVCSLGLEGPSSLAHFLIGSFIFLELSCRSCLYIFEISCLSVASFAIIFSHSEGCLFTLLIVSFVVQKLLRLIRSHLFIFANFCFLLDLHSSDPQAVGLETG